MLMKTKGRACLLVLGLASVAVLMMVLAGGSSSQLFSRQGPSRDYQLLAGPTYKLDPRWPRYPELLTGDVFAVAVDPYAGVVYVAQRGERAFIYLYSLVRWKQKTINTVLSVFSGNYCTVNIAITPVIYYLFAF